MKLYAQNQRVFLAESELGNYSFDCHTASGAKKLVSSKLKARGRI